MHRLGKTVDRLGSHSCKLFKLRQAPQSITTLSYLHRINRKNSTNNNLNNHLPTKTTKRTASSSAATASTANATTTHNGLQNKKLIEIEAPQRPNLHCYKPIKCGNGFVIDTMVSDTNVQISNKDIHPMDGNTSAAYVAYANSEVSFIYPISPATSMGEAMDTMASQGKTNVVSHQPVRVEVMQSEGGAAGAVHGALTAGCLSSTFTASQGLLLMIPNMYLIAGELMPCVMHVAARTLAKQALCIYNDHSDVMAVRQTGWALLASNTPQEVMDLALVSHLATVKARIPFLHFFDGNRTSHEIQNIHQIPYKTMEGMVDHDLINSHLRSIALNPVNPIARGTGQRPDIFWQSNMASERFYRQCTKHIESSMNDLEQLTGRRYNLFDYFGHPEAENVIVVMGSAAQTTQQYIRSTIANCTDPNAPECKIGVVKVRAYRPWSAQHFFAAMPDTVKRVGVIDRTREEGSLGNPLFLDVSVSFKENPTLQNTIITGGVAGIGQKEITPNMIEAVFDNLQSDAPRNRYNVGIIDDVTYTSLDYNHNVKENDLSLPQDIKQCLFWGLGSDGTVGSTKQSIKIIGENTGKNCQGFFSYDSKKSGGVTLSQLRFGDSQVEAEYQITSADYIGVHNTSDQFIKKLDLLAAIKPNGIVVFNSPWNLEDMNKHLPARMKQQIAENNVQLYNIDAGKIARSLGLKGRINMIMQSAFYQLGNILPSQEKASELLKNAIVQMFSRKGEEVVNMNINAVNAASENLVKIEYKREDWLHSRDMEELVEEWDYLLQAGKPDFVENIMEPCMRWEGDDLPVSAFDAGGQFPVGTTRYERRGAAPEIPLWLPDKCTQCNYCAIVCPHAVIRPFLLNKDEAKAAPSDFMYRKAAGGSEMSGLNYSIQVAPLDCTGCAVCVQACPDDALVMADFEEHGHKNLPNFEFAMNLPNRQPSDKYTVKGSQFEQPLLEFHGACAGCGETPYVKLVTQMFGQQMMIANASGCSSVWGGTCTTHPYTVNKETGRGPAWGRSLFEDNAEYGYGMALASLQRRKRLAMTVQEYINEVEESGNDENMDSLIKLFKRWIKSYDNFNENNKVCDELDRHELYVNSNTVSKSDNSKLYHIFTQKDMFRPQSQWLIGGDGWAYDIGSSGLDHVLSKGENINVLILDTEIYSNTGGQSSKASTASQVTKFESLGKSRHKKDLGSIAMAYGDVYVASVSLGADYNQCVKAFKEAAEYPGTSIIMAYSPCIDWGIDTKDMADIQKIAVETGYWENYRYDPRLAVKGQNPLHLDSRRIKKPIKHYLESENRFKQLKRQHSERAAQLQGSLEDWIQDRHMKLQRQSMDDLELLDFLKSQLGEESADNSNKITILYGSETGNANEFSNIIASDLNKRGIRTKVLACDDYDYSNLSKENMVLFIIATCGQGQLPKNCLEMYNTLSNLSDDSIEGEVGGSLENTKVAVFGMGDSHYVYFNEAAKLYDDLFRNKLKGHMMLEDFGQGDDQDDEKYETKWEEFSTDLYNKLSLPEPERILLPASCSIEFHNDISQVENELVVPAGASIIPIVDNRLLTPIDYDRDTRHYEFDTTGLSYEVGDSLGVYPHNPTEKVIDFCRWYGLNPTDVIMIEDHNETRREKDPFPSHMTVLQLFTQVLDIFGRPKKRFYELLSLVATDESEKSHLGSISNDEYKYNIANTLNHADLLQKFPSCRPSIEHMIDYIPKIKPRLYSIASSPNEKPDNIALCVVVDDWTTPDTNVYKQGLCSSYLTKQLPSSKNVVVGKVNAGVVAMPSTHESPMIMAGLGTGLAPLRGMVRDRAHAINTDPEVAATVGPMALYFGARYRAKEFLYENEWVDFHDGGKGPLTHLRTAFSRDQKHKIYIQDRIMEDYEMIHDYLVNKNGYFYACGSSAVQDLKHNVAQCLHKVDNKTFKNENDAAQYVTDMMIEGRYCIESW